MLGRDWMSIEAYARQLPPIVYLAVTPPVGGLLFLMLASVVGLMDKVLGVREGGKGLSLRKIMTAACSLGAAVFMVNACAEICVEIVTNMLGANVGTDPLRIAVRLVDLATAGDSDMIMFASCLFVGAAVVFIVENILSDKGALVVFVMLIHTASEGAGLALLQSESAFAALHAVAMHNLLEGAVVASSAMAPSSSVDDADVKAGVAAGRGGLWATLKILLGPCVSHAPQWVTLALIRASDGQLFSASTELGIQSFAVGSMMATVFLELIPEGVHLVGIAPAVAVGAAMAYVIM